MVEWLGSLLGAALTLGQDAGPAPAPPPAAPPTGPSPAGPQAPGGDWLVQMLTLFVPLGLVFWLLIWRPESKRRKEREHLLNSVKPKDKVTTVGGMHGTVLEVEKDELLLLVDPRKDVRLRFRRSAIDHVEPAEGAEKK